MAKGYLCVVLHAHLPFVCHPEKEHTLEENWLYEAITETYLPLLETFEHLRQEKIPFRVTMTMTPTLISLLQHKVCQERYIKHIDRLIELAEKELDRTGREPHYHGLALLYFRKFKESKKIFTERYDCDLVRGFKSLQDSGLLEIITCCATHAFLPIIGSNRHSARAQILVAAEHYRKTFNRPPKGIWLPECAYTSGIEEILQEAGIKYFFVDTHGILNADPRPRYNVYAPIYTPNGVAAFARDPESSKQVWSSKEGYPGDVDYREYYRDIGFDREWDYIKPYVHPEGIRINTGIKYWRVTGKGEYKEAYRPDWAQKKAAMHADDFLYKRHCQVDYLSEHMDRKPIIIAPYDAELFGHWWYEGPMWLDFLIRKTVFDQNKISLATPSDYLREYPTNQVAIPSGSSWGYKGYHEFWLNGTNDWIYRHLYIASRRMYELADKYRGYLQKGAKPSIGRRALNQAARELLLAESSDWPFIMRTETMVPYAHRRIKGHINRFTKLYEDLCKGTVDESWLKELEFRDNIFSNIECASYYIKDEARQKKAETVHIKEYSNA